ncbi:DUF3179 domain-containing (seleno)protein [Tautonia plasticadhaerens]|uniref:DUF3179 domain-containing protein n=1 Tax=Tautonia plasticadhaerens TaxID=2527974 RepID=A0A518H4Z4_9BACT|nr:DUF3179 domain-containing (seleno)protein [Tautonia plasticadhaerens]QDV35909.1 hypothetical protein ElP_38170 [Tautonia plasticadhaerens]
MSSERQNPVDPTGPSAVPRGALLCGIMAMSGFVLYQGPSLWDEVSALKQEVSSSRDNAVVGYVGISPNPSAAQPPGEWFRVEGERLRLWGGWHPVQGHRWFLAQVGDLDRSKIDKSIGRDLFQGVDVPVVETDGGPISGRIPDGHDVDGMVYHGRPCAYPVLVLDKVLVVNDEVDGVPLLILFTRSPGGGGSPVFEATVDGRRMVLGFSGYRYEGLPLLYDREHEGLWIEREQGIVSLSGPDRGRVLRRVGRLDRMSWRDWSRRHQQTRVLVGADRSPEATAL